MGFTVIMFAVLFVGVYLVFNFIFDDMLKKEKYTKISELVLLTKKFDLDKKKMDYKKALNGIALINALIVAVGFTITDLLPFNIVINLLIAFVVILIMMFGMYFAYGNHLKKKWGKK